jgi:hypothetical protein
MYERALRTLLDYLAKKNASRRALASRSAAPDTLHIANRDDWKPPVTVHFIWFLTRPRTDDEIQTMLVSAHVITCACVHAPDALSPPFLRYIHDLGLRTLMRPSDEPPFDNLVGFMTQGFLSLRNMGYKGSPRLFVSLARRKRRDWPDCVTPSQLLPYGREQTVRDLATWFGARNTSLQLQITLLTLLRRIARARLSPSSSPLRSS